MKLERDNSIQGLLFTTLMLLISLVPAVAHAQSNGVTGIVDDWTTHHVVFSDPGTLMDAVMNGRREQWEQIVNDPRYRMQQVRRSAVTANAIATPGRPASSDSQPVFERLGDNRFRRNENSQSLEGKWSVTITSTGGGPAVNMYPAKYTFSTTGTPACTDFVAFPNSVAGVSGTTPNIVGVNNLYAGTGACIATGASPPFFFSYFVGTGTVQTSPVLSLNGTKVAFIESISSGSKFHVLTIGTTGTNVTSTSSDTPVPPCTVVANGVTSTPCTTNNAVDTYRTLSGTNVMVTRSSPFVDYVHDTAYVGDDLGKLHKFTGVFLGTLTEVTTGNWPITVTPNPPLSAGTYDSVTGNVFIGGNGGNLWCVNTATPALCSTPSITLGGGSSPAVLAGPTVDSTRGTVFVGVNSASNATLSEVTTAMKNPSSGTAGSAITATMGINGTDLYEGAFDNAYLTSSTGTGYRYFCGNQTGAANPTLWRVAITNGVMSGTNDGGSFQLSTATGTAADCTPITEIYNPNGSMGARDYLFVGVKSGGTGTGCSGTTNCVMSFNVLSLSTLGTSAFVAGSSFSGATGMSGMIVDNVSSATGASQIYFGVLAGGTGNQLSQSGLK
jgi:hypothetical protein